MCCQMSYAEIEYTGWLLQLQYLVVKNQCCNWNKKVRVIFGKTGSDSLKILWPLNGKKIFSKKFCILFINLKLRGVRVTFSISLITFGKSYSGSSVLYFADINECEFELICPRPQLCENTVGSYKCVGSTTLKCPPGFYFNSDQQSCEGARE